MGKARKPLKPPPDECRGGELISITCWDGSQIITHICKNGSWQATDNTCPLPTHPCKHGDTITQPCQTGEPVTTHVCVEGTWRATGHKCPDFPERKCNLLTAVVYLNKCLAFWRGG